MDRNSNQGMVWQTAPGPLFWGGVGVVLSILFGVGSVEAQRVRFSESTPVPSMNYSAVSPATPITSFQPPTGFPSTLPNGSVLPNTPAPMVPLGSGSIGGMGTPTFDPYAPTMRPSTVGVLPQGSGWSNFWGNPQSVTPSPTLIPNNYPANVYPQSTPPVLFPGYNNNQGWGNSGWNSGGNSLWGNGWGNNPGVYPGGTQGWGNGWNPNNPYGNGWFNNNPNGPLFNNMTAPQPLRFFVGPRFRHTWVEGQDDPASLETNDSDVSLVFAIPQFMGSTQPLYLVPSFSIHTFEGPRLATADIPGNAYSAFLDAGWESDPMRTFGADLGVRVGVFSGFDTFNSDSFRVMGKGLGRVRLTPNATLRGGVFYIDRNRYKLVPAGGILWIPNPDTRFDIFFPEPKLSHYLTTLGTSDIWWYIIGYYGGGTWTVKRQSGNTDSIDINEMRLALGFEFGKNDFIRQGRRLGFIEGGYAFKRELLFKDRPQDNLDLEDGWVVRAGVGY